jgi:hypothetical protein
MSFVAALDAPARAGALDEITAILDRHGVPAQGEFAVPNVTVMRWARRR